MKSQFDRSGLAPEHRLVYEIGELDRAEWRRFVADVEAWRRQLAKGQSPARATSLARIAAEEIAIAARDLVVPRREFLARLRQVERRGYSTLVKRVTIACVALQWCVEARSDSRFARALAARARRRITKNAKQTSKRYMLSAIEWNLERLDASDARSGTREQAL